MKSLCVAGIGNPIMGDDGVGVAVVKELESILPENDDLSFLFLYSDLFEMAEHLFDAAHFIFVDAVVAREAGRVIRFVGPPPALAPSNHQTDIATVMQMLKNLDLIQPFPAWELWGVTITPPLTLGESLSRAVKTGLGAAVDELANVIKRRCRVRK